MSEAKSYEWEVLEAGTHEVHYAPDGMKPFSWSYVVCLMREVQGGQVHYVGTCFNVTKNQPICFNGKQRYLTSSHEQALSWYRSCMGYLKKQAKPA